MSEFLTPLKLAERIQAKTGLSAEVTKKFAYEFFAIARRELKSNDQFTIHRFGTFRKIWIEESIARNPQTGELLTIPAHYRVKFTPAAAVAARINARYAHLKAVPIAEPVAEPAESKDISPDFSDFYKHMKKNEMPAPIQNPPEEYDDEEDDETEEKSRLHIPLILLLILIAVAAAAFFLLRSCRSGRSDNRQGTAENVKTVPAPQPAAVQPQPRPEPIPEPVKQEPEPVKPVPVQQEPARPAEEPAVPVQKAPEKRSGPTVTVSTQSGKTYRVPAGGCYHKIAESELGNIHLWPYVYAANCANHDDPDFIRVNDIVKLPAQPDLQRDADDVQKAYITTYNAYNEVIKKHPSSAKNALRQFRAVRVLVSGDILYPGFIEKHRASISSRDYQEALAARKLQRR